MMNNGKKEKFMYVLWRICGKQVISLVELIEMLEKFYFEPVQHICEQAKNNDSKYTEKKNVVD